MAKQNKVQGRPLTRKQRQLLRTQISEASTFSLEELLAAVRQQPRGSLAQQAVFNLIWPQFVESNGMDKMESRALEHLRNIANIFFKVGVSYDQRYEELLNVLDVAKDKEAPEE